MRYSTTRSKAIQLSAVLTLSAIVSGCTIPNVSAVATESASFNKADDPEILHDAPGQSEEYYRDQNRFFDSEFDYDDAAILARYWGESISDAKARIGDKLEADDGVAIVNGLLVDAQRADGEPEIVYDAPGRSMDFYDDQQRFFASEFDYSDAAILARYWGESVDDSKARIGDKLEAADGVATVSEILEEATRATASPDFEPLTRRGPVDPNRQAYLDSSFDYFDAEQLAIFWGMDIDEAKARIGRTLLQDEGFDVVTETLQAARRANNEGDELGSAQPSVERSRQAYFDSDFAYEDATLLAAFWGTDVDDAKVRMGNKIIFNGPDFLNEIVEEAEAAAYADGDRAPTVDVNYERYRDAYFDSDYSFNDAVLLADYWGMDINDTKARMGSKILRGPEMIQGLNDYLQAAEAEAVRRINARNQAQ